eukprot:2532289-Pyramimonas_sp.AAC.1
MGVRRGGPQAALRAGQAHCGGAQYGPCPCMLRQPRAVPIYLMRSRGRNRPFPRVAANWLSTR